MSIRAAWIDEMGHKVHDENQVHDGNKKET